MYSGAAQVVAALHGDNRRQMMDPETFRSLLHDWPHWEFELFVGGVEMIVFDLIIGVIIAPFVLKHWKHHLARDKRESV